MTEREIAPDASSSPISWISAVVWTFVTFMLNLLGVVLVPFEVGTGILIPICLPLIATANIALPKVFYRGVQIAWTRYLPAAIWAIVTIAAATPRTDGDLLLPGNTYSAVISLLYLGVGAASAVAGLVLAKTDLKSFRRSRPRSDNGAQL